MMVALFGTIGGGNWPEEGVMRLRLADGPLQLGWSHCGDTSDFIGAYFAAKCGNETDSLEARHSIGYLANELLENSVKFRGPGDIAIEARLDQRAFEMKLTNFISSQTAVAFQSLLREITTSDPGDLLIRRIEENAASESASGSGLGLLTLMSDYGIRLGWSFSHSTVRGGSVLLETHAHLPL